MTPDTGDRYGGFLKIQVDPVVVTYLVEIQHAQHLKITDLEKAVKESLHEYVTHYQEASAFRALPDWAKP